MYESWIQTFLTDKEWMERKYISSVHNMSWIPRTLDISFFTKHSFRIKIDIENNFFTHPIYHNYYDHQSGCYIMKYIHNDHAYLTVMSFDIVCFVNLFFEYHTQVDYLLVYEERNKYKTLTNDDLIQLLLTEDHHSYVDLHENIAYKCDNYTIYKNPYKI